MLPVGRPPDHSGHRQGQNSGLRPRLRRTTAFRSSPLWRLWLYRWRSKPVQRQSQLRRQRSEEHTSELQSLMRISYAVFCLKKKKKNTKKTINIDNATTYITTMCNTHDQKST